jgi:thiamine biosynthesis protein ThiS
MLTLTINGKPREIAAETPLLQYLADNGINPRAVAIEHNGDILKRDRFEEVVLRAGDNLEILRMIGGG